MPEPEQNPTVPADAIVHAPANAATAHCMCITLDGIDAESVAALCAAARAAVLRCDGARVVVQVTGPGEHPRNYTMGRLGELIAI